MTVVFLSVLKTAKVVPVFKGYLRYKTILCHKVAIDVQLMNFFIFLSFLFFRSRDIKIFVF